MAFGHQDRGRASVNTRCAARPSAILARVSPADDPLVPPTNVACPACGEPLVHVYSEMSSGAFRTQAAAMPQRPMHFYDCPGCQTCWKLGQRLLPDPVRQIARDTNL